MSSKIYLIRHGITEGNQKKWFYGAADIPLVEEGKEELRKQADRGVYPKVPVDTDYYTTGLLRTEQTLELIYGKQPHGIIENLQEMRFGEYECHSYEELKDNPEFSAWCWDKTGDAVLSGGETRNEFAERIAGGLKELIGLHRLKELSHRHSGKDAVSVVVCHGGVISAVMQQLFPGEKGNMWDWMPEPGFGYSIDFERGEPIMFEKIEDKKKLGFGLMRLPMKGEEVDAEKTNELVDMFLAKGFTYFDTAWGYLDGKSEEAVKTALVERHPRESFQLATKLPAWCASTEEEAKAMFDTSLQRTGAGYFDYFLLHNMGEQRTQTFDDFHIWDFLAEKKAAGLIKNLGFSSHARPDELDALLTAHPDMDFVQLQINYADWESPIVEARACYEVARKHNKPIIVMEPVKGGSLASLPERAAEVFKAADTNASLASWAIRYAASLDGVMMVLSGMNEPEQVADNMAVMEDFVPLSQDEMETVERVRKVLEEMPQVPCTRCNYCIKGCPQQVAIPGVFRAMNTELIFGNRTEAERNYEWETREGGIASKCIECGACEKVCPQRIDIIQQLKKAKEMFE